MKCLCSALLITLVVAGSTPAAVCPVVCPLGDLDGDCAVGINDVRLFAFQWLALTGSCAGPGCADFNQLNGVNYIDFALWQETWQKRQTGLVINEFMALNNSDSGIADPNDGDFNDWFEIYNRSDQPVDIAGMYLTDNLMMPTKWQIPTGSPQQTTIAPQGYLLLWADDETFQGPLHVGFKLSANGEQIGLTDIDGVTLIDSFTFGNQKANQSMGRFPDGCEPFVFMNLPTPETSNVISYEVVINEIMFHPGHNLAALEAENLNEEFIELLNIGDTPVSTSGWKVNKGLTYSFPLAPGDLVIEPEGFLVLVADKAAFLAIYPTVDPNRVLGGWVGRLSNRSEEIEILDNANRRVDRVEYADTGDWGVRIRGPVTDGHKGWTWSDDTDGGGKSLELMNPLLANNRGQNWKASLVEGGTPGAANTVASSDIAPMLVDLKHRPMIPRAGDPVTVTVEIRDEDPNSVSVSLFYREDTSAYVEGTDPTENLGSYTQLTMLDDGLNGDGAPGDGEYGATIPAQTDGTIIEFFVKAVDDLLDPNARTWPAPSLIGGIPKQVTNLLYQVDDTFDPNAPWTPGSQPFYRMIFTEAERAELADIGNGNGGPGGEDDSDSNAQMNATFISQDGIDMKVRYNIGVRNRGKGSRDDPPNNYRVNFRHDRPWNKVTAININSKYPHRQIIGSTLFRMAGLPAHGARPVLLRVNGQDLANNVDTPMYGSYAHLDVYDTDWADKQYPDDGAGNIYKANSDNKQTDLDYLGTNDQDYINAGYTKRTNSAENDWSGLINLTNVLNNEPDETYVEEVQKVAQVDQWLKWIAMHAMLANNETNLGIGDGDDYFIYRGIKDPNFVLLPHDLDTIVRGSGDVNDSIFRAKDIAALNRLMNHENFAPKYYEALLEIINGVFSADQADPLIDQVLDYTPSSARDTIKDFIVDRNAYVLTQIPQNFSVSSGLPVVSGFPKTGSGTTSLSGDLDSVNARSVLINGVEATVDPVAGTWSTGNTVALNPGINRVIVQMFDGFGGTGEKLDESFIDIWYDDASEVLVSGTVATTTWTAAPGPYHVTADITIPNGVTLTIEAGTTVFVDSSAGFNVEGRLVAEGSEFQRIRLTRVPGSSSRWGGLNFDNTLEDNRLAYLDMEYGDDRNINNSRGKESIFVGNSQLLMDNVTWPNQAKLAIELNNSNVIVRNSIFPTITGSEIVHGKNIPPTGYLIFDGNTFGTTDGGDVMDFSGGKLPDAIIQILNNTFLGGGDDALDLDGTDAYLEGNVFMNFHNGCDGCGGTTSNAIATGSNGGDVADITVVRNIFYDNDHAILIKQGSFLRAAFNTFASSTFETIAFDEINRGVSPGAGGIIDSCIFQDMFAPFGPIDSSPPGDDPNIIAHRSILPAAQHNLGVGNIDADPLFVDPPGDYQLQPGSPAQDAGHNGLDMGAFVPQWASISGEPPSVTHRSDATLTVAGPGMTHYKFRLNGGAFGSETPVETLIELTSLSDSLSYTVEVIGKNVAGVWQSESEPTESKTWTIDTALSRLVINEVLARNNTAVNHAGAFPDMIELHYNGAGPIDLSGFSISDKLNDPKRFVFPSGTEMTDGQFLVLNDDPNILSPGFHLPFSLDGDGEGVYLFDMNTLLIDSIEFGKQVADLSIGRIGQAGQWTLTKPTLGSMNISQRTGNPALIKINEWLANGDVLFDDDFLELYNPDTLPVPLAAMRISDNSVPRLSQHVFEPLSFIAALGFVDFKADGKNTSGHINFRLSADMEILTLLDQTGTTIDKILYGPQTTDVSQGRFPDGSLGLSFFELPTPGSTNLIP